MAVDKLEGEFIIPASDGKGHSIRQWFRCHSGHDRQTEIVLRSKRFPYRTKGDLFRHALVRHLHWLETLEEVPSVMREVDAIMDILRDVEFRKDFAATFDAMEKMIGDHVKAGETQEARRVTAEILARMNMMPDGFWKRRYTNELKSRWGYLLSGGPTAKMRGGEKEAEE